MFLLKYWEMRKYIQKKTYNNSFLKIMWLAQAKIFKMRWISLWYIRLKELKTETLSKKKKKIILINKKIAFLKYIVFVFILLFVSSPTLLLADGHLLKFEWQQVSRTLLSILAELNFAVVWICPPISYTSSPCFQAFGDHSRSY